MRPTGIRHLRLRGFEIATPGVVAALSGDVVSKARIAEDVGADLVEVRLDLADGDPLEAMRGVRKATGLPVIATNRMVQEGGGFKGDEADRGDILCKAAEWADLVDVELRADLRDRVVEGIERPIIISYHDFESAPELDNLRTIRDEIFLAGGDIAKIAVTPTNLGECLDLLRLLLETTRPICIIGMGKTARHLRAVAPIYGSVLTFGHLGLETAPGQMSVAELRRTLDALVG